MKVEASGVLLRMTQLAICNDSVGPLGTAQWQVMAIANAESRLVAVTRVPKAKTLSSEGCGLGSHSKIRTLPRGVTEAPPVA